MMGDNYVLAAVFLYNYCQVLDHVVMLTFRIVQYSIVQRFRAWLSCLEGVLGLQNSKS